MKSAMLATSQLIPSIQIVAERGESQRAATQVQTMMKKREK